MRSLLLATLLLACSERVPDSTVVDPHLNVLAASFVRGREPVWNETLTIRADGRFDRSYSDHTGAYRYSGSASIVDERLVLHGLPPNPEVADVIETRGLNRFYVVRWSERVYLIEEEFMQSFCDSVNAGQEPRSQSDGDPLLREGDWLRPVDGLPAVPNEWSPMLLR